MKSASLQLFDFSLGLLRLSSLFACALTLPSQVEPVMTEYGWRWNWGISLTVLSDYLRFPHSHTCYGKDTIVTQTLNTLCETMAFFLPRGGKVKRVQEGGKSDGRQTKPCQTPLGQIWHCVIQSLAPHPTWSLLNTHSISHSQKTHCLNQQGNTISSHATKPKILFSP